MDKNHNNIKTSRGYHKNITVLVPMMNEEAAGQTSSRGSRTSQSSPCKFTATRYGLEGVW